MNSVLITGGNRGLGRVAAQRIASDGSKTIVLAGRNRAETEAAAKTLREDTAAAVHAVQMDVSSLQSVRDGAGQVEHLLDRGDLPPLGALMLNAGVQFHGKPEFSADGFEKTFATNCLGPFLLMLRLTDRLAEGGRIVWTASGTHDPTTMDGKMVGKAAEPDARALAQTGREGKSLSGGVRYTSSKLCDIFYSYEAARRLRAVDRRIASIAYDPGFVPETGLVRDAPAIVRRLLRSTPAKSLFKRLGVTPGSLAFSGESLARVAIDPEFADGSGKYIQSNDGRLTETRSSATSYDTTRAAKLWRDSLELIGVKPDETPQWAL